MEIIMITTRLYDVVKLPAMYWNSIAMDYLDTTIQM